MLLLLSLVVFFAPRSPAQSSWAAAASGNWNTAASWTPAVVPGAGINVSINIAGTFTVTYNSPMAAASIASLTLGSATSIPTLTLTAPGFNVTGTTTLADSATEVLNINSGGVMNNGTLNINSRNALVNVNSGGTMTNGNTQVATTAAMTATASCKSTPGPRRALATSLWAATISRDRLVFKSWAARSLPAALTWEIATLIPRWW